MVGLAMFFTAFNRHHEERAGEHLQEQLELTFEKH